MSAVANPEALELIERLMHISSKLDVVAANFTQADKDNNLPGEFVGEAYITIDVARELEEVSCALDVWARENGGPQSGRLTGTETES